MTELARLPDWPRLLDADAAAAYLSIGLTTLREKGPAAKELGRRRLYDRKDLDRWVDALGGQPLDLAEADAQAVDTERQFFEARRRARG